MTTTYAIGDVHGRADLLGALLEHIQAAREPNSRVVFLGDIIDRGPDSRKSMDLVVETLATIPGSRLILGNHEEFFLRFIYDLEHRTRITMAWMGNGGVPTIESYGVAADASPEVVIEYLRENFSSHLKAIREAETIVETDNYALVHAGIEPGVPLKDQDARTTRWIRQDFLNCRETFPKIIVHGHTPTGSQRPETSANRIALDTGACVTDRLSCAVLEDTATPSFLAAEGRGAHVRVMPTDAMQLP